MDPRVEALASQAHPATAIATGITIRRAQNFTCPARCGIIYGFRRPPRVSDISDGRLKDLAAAAAPTVRGIINVEDGTFWGGRTLRELRSCFVGLEPVYLLGSAAPGICVQLIGGDENEEVFPLAAFCFRSREDWDLENIPDMRATLSVPVAIQGLAVAVVETDDHSDGEANVDLEYVGIEGYAYVPPGHEPVPPDHRL